MKSLLLVLLLVLLTFLYGARSGAGPEGSSFLSDNGRYRLVPAEVNISTTVEMQFKQLFKIDSRTGQTWVFAEILGSTNIVREWLPVSEAH
jgi:hypothetical protein